VAGAAPDALLRAAAAGTLPEWAVVSEHRRAHIRRVAALMQEWSVALGLDEAEQARWRAIAWLHDALRDSPAAALRPLVPEPLRDVPGPLLHGPAAARRLEEAGVTDRGMLLAIAFHTLGHPRFDAAGRALYLADFLEPGRTFMIAERAAMRARMPDDRDGVLLEVLGARLVHLLDAGRTIRDETVDFWNAVAGERGSARQD
jgi:HD superfamily phosphohydrolase YqeK